MVFKFEAMSSKFKNYADNQSQQISMQTGCCCLKYLFRVDTEKYSYLFRLNPEKGEYSYCYCYRRDWLDSHIKQAERGIRFIDSHYKEKFRIPDGGRIGITSSWGEVNEYTCRYIDEFHLEVGNNLYHIREFEEFMEKNGATVAPIE